jgi:hypothetical protein
LIDACVAVELRGEPLCDTAGAAAEIERRTSLLGQCRLDDRPLVTVDEIV